MSNLFTFTYLIWFLSEVILNRIKRSVPSDQKNEDRNSLATIWITIFMIIPLSIFIAIYFPAHIFRNSLYEYAGLIVIMLGIIVRFLAIKSLGKFFTVDVTILENHQLKKTGIYKIVRHPSYAGSILSFIGFGLSLDNWISLCAITVAIFTVFSRRIKIEENVLLKRFGKEYADYMKKTYRLIPWIY